MELIKRIKRKLSKLRTPNEEGDYYEGVIIGENSVTSSINISIRGGDKSRRLSIGNESVISGSYFFENAQGKISIGDRTFIGGGTKFICINEIIVGDDVLISWGCTIMDNNAHSIVWENRKNDVKDWRHGIEKGELGNYKDWSNVKNGKIVIHDKVWIGFDVIILKGVVIGARSVIAAGSVVVKDVPEDVVVAGNPAKIIKHIDNDLGRDY